MPFTGKVVKVTDGDTIHVLLDKEGKSPGWGPTPFSAFAAPFLGFRPCLGSPFSALV